MFWGDVSAFWFNPEWTTDDALQQVYPFHKVYHSNIFKGDFITQTMEGYLAPLHYYLCYAITFLTKDPIMMSHWVMLIQILLTLIFLFLLLKKLTNIGVASFGCFWLLHTRSAMQRFTGGLPRGWSAPAIAIFLYCLINKKHKSVLLSILFACLVHPPAAFLCALTYGAWLLFFSIKKSTRKDYLPWLINLILLSPFYCGLIFYIIWRPEEVGQMVDYKTALTLPELQRPDGRFPFVPLKPVEWELKMFAMQPFWNRLFNPTWHFRAIIFYLVPLFLLSAIFFSYKQKVSKNKELIPSQLWVYLICILSAYFASRALAFKLYVPDRHLQIPMSIFWIVFTLVFLHSFLVNRKSYIYYSSFAFLLLIIYLGTGNGLQGSANFNYSLKKKGNLFIVLKKHTSEDALIAGHPTFIDGVPLFAMRRAYATTETAHPFYPLYFKEMVRRHEISLKAHYAKDLDEVLRLLKPEGIDFFVFNKQRFYPEALQKESHFAPLNHLAKELTSRHYNDYAYKMLPDKTSDDFPFLLYRDQQSAIIDIKKLERFLNNEI